MILRCILLSIFGLAVFIVGGVEELWSVMLSEYNRVSTQSAQIHTMFGKEVELKYTARAIALILLFIIVFVTWPILNFLTGLVLYVLRTIVRRKGLIFVILTLLTASIGAIWYFGYTIDEIRTWHISASGHVSTLLNSIISISTKVKEGL